jgi:hypothetical protein
MECNKSLGNFEELLSNLDAAVVKNSTTEVGVQLHDDCPGSCFRYRALNI